MKKSRISIKMNKFSFWLHSALFSLDGYEPSRDYFGYGVDRKIDFNTEVQKMQEGVKVELIDLANGVIDALDYSTVITEVVNSKKNTEKFEENKARFYARIESKNTDWVKYAEVWNVRIWEWFKDFCKRQ